METSSSQAWKYPFLSFYAARNESATMKLHRYNGIIYTVYVILMARATVVVIEINKMGWNIIPKAEAENFT